MTERLRVALIGAGYMGRLHAEKLAARADVEFVGVADPDQGRAGQLAATCRCRAFANWSELLGNAQAAVVAVPTERHAELARAFLEAGVHVLVEKPIAATLEEGEDMVRAAHGAGRVLQVGHVERFNAAWRALAARIERPLYIDAERLSGFKNRGADVDVVLDLMIHDLDLACALARAPIVGVSACGFRVLTGDIDIANARLEFAGGCVASITASRVSQTALRKLRVFQPELYASADLQAARLRYVRQAGDSVAETEEDHAGGDALAAQAAAFVAAARGTAPPPVTGEDGVRALELALSVGRLVRERLERYAGGA
jgi:predicted dehydrogenase